MVFVSIGGTIVLIASYLCLPIWYGEVRVLTFVWSYNSGLMDLSSCLRIADTLNFLYLQFIETIEGVQIITTLLPIWMTAN